MTCRPLPVRLSCRLLMARKAQASVVFLALVAGSLAAAPALAEPPEIASKRADAQQVLSQIEELDASLGRAIEAYNKATVRLDAIEQEQKLNRRDLRIAQLNLKREQAALAQRLVAMYTDADASSWLGVMLGAGNVGQLVDRLDTVERLATQDRRVVRQVAQFKQEVERTRRKLASFHDRQADFVSQRQAQKASIESQLAERRQLVDSIRGEIERLEAEERARQERLRREAQARLAAERAAAKAAAEAAQRAERAEREARRVQAQHAADEAAAAADEAAAAAARTDSEEHSHRDASGSDDTTSEPPYTPEITEDEVGVVAETPEASVVPSSGGRGTDVVAAAMQYLGVPYVWGGADPSGFDCSGLILYAYAQLGISLPHYTGDQWQLGVAVSKDQLEPGDIVFFNGLGHNGMYIGGGQFIHAPRTGDVVKISNLSDSWYAATWEGARRILT